MSQFKVTFKRIEAYYQTIIVDAPTRKEARDKADILSCEGIIEFDHLSEESDLLDEYIICVEEMS